jgi:hypothetical protein
VRDAIPINEAWGGGGVLALDDRQHGVALRRNKRWLQRVITLMSLGADIPG